MTDCKVSLVDIPAKSVQSARAQGAQIQMQCHRASEQQRVLILVMDGPDLADSSVTWVEGGTSPLGSVSPFKLDDGESFQDFISRLVRIGRESFEASPVLELNHLRVCASPVITIEGERWVWAVVFGLQDEIEMD